MTSLNASNKISQKDVRKFRGQLLDWYDRHARALPWRKRKDEQSNAYHTWLSEIMLQQTTVTAVMPYYTKFLEKWPTVKDLADAPEEEVMSAWAGLGYYARARNLHKCARVVADDLEGVFPAEQKLLQALPGIGDYTSAAIRSIAFNLPATVVDGNVERVMARLFKIEESVPKSKPKLKALAHLFFEKCEDRPGDLAQAFMDLGATICMPKSPKCMLCPVSTYCAGYKAGKPELLPRKDKQKPKPQKYGHVYWIEDGQGRILLHKRPERGILGGMIGLPTSDWVEKKGFQSIQNPEFLNNMAVKDFGEGGLHITHSFTHFDLRLDLKHVRVSSLPLQDGFFLINQNDIGGYGFPTLFKKALKFYGLQPSESLKPSLETDIL